MQKTSTQTPTAPRQVAEQLSPRKKTIDAIRQFARIYMPLANMPGVVLN